ncbi:conjugal transfer protein [Streptomyces sp. NPDC054841]
MTDHSSSAGGVGGGQPSGQPAQFGPAEQAAWQQAQAQAQAQGHGQQQGQPHQGQYPHAQHQPQQPQPQANHQPAPGPYGYPTAAAPAPQQQLPSEAARAQVAAAWVRRAPQAAVPPSEAAVPTLPPRASRPAGESKKDKRERAKAERKAEYERKKAEREGRKQGGGTAPAAGRPHAAPAAPATATATAAPASAAPQPRASAHAGAGFDVPRPGGRLPAGGRRTHVALRATLLITTCVFALGSCGVMGLAIGKSSGAQTAALDDKDVTRYRLTEFPTQAAATFAEEYAKLCMTYAPKDADARRESLTRYASTGVDRDCGWGGQGTQSATLANWDGTVEELPEYGKNGRYLGIQVTLSTGRVTTLSIPVYVKDLATASGLRIVGDVGEMPLPVRGTAPEVDQDDDVVDQDLSDQLKAKVLPGYFVAWSASDTTSMTRFTTTDATHAATTGLAGALSAPQVRDVAALAPAGTDDGDEITYKDGQSVQARVTVEWGSGGGETGSAEAGTKVLRSYRVTVVNTAQGWFIKDIRGGVLDPAGGRADEGETDAPAPDASTPPASGGSTPPATGGSTPPAGASTPPATGRAGSANRTS